jgi:hypothetical protein
MDPELAICALYSGLMLLCVFAASACWAALLRFRQTRQSMSDPALALPD